MLMKFLFQSFFPHLSMFAADDDGSGGGEDKNKKPSVGADQQLEEANKKIKELEDKTNALEGEKKGIYRDLKQTQEKARQLEQSLEHKEKKINEEDKNDIFAELGDEDFITGKMLKKFGKNVSERERARMIADLRVRADERVANDEARLEELCEAGSAKYPVPYKEAIDAFLELADKDPTLWSQYDAAKFKPGGRPADFAYKTAIREHAKFKDANEKKAREKLLDELDDRNKAPKLRNAGGGGKSLNDMSDKEISALSDEELDKLSRK